MPILIANTINKYMLTLSDLMNTFVIKYSSKIAQIIQDKVLDKFDQMDCNYDLIWHAFALNFQVSFRPEQ